jgi:hypothetical protein
MVIARHRRSLKQRQAIDTTAGEKKTPINSASAVLIKGDGTMRNANVTPTQVEFKTHPFWLGDLVSEMKERQVKLTRTQAKELCRATFGPGGLRDWPRGRGQLVFRLPNTNDGLILDFGKRAPRFQPSWVTGRVHRGALRTVLRIGLRLELLLTAWLGPILRLLRIGGRGGSAAIWARGIAQ